jgi:ketosteroid isomerase-like protein
VIALLIALQAAANPANAVAEIRAMRAQSNAAIAAHDYSRMEPLLAPDFTVLPGSLGSPLGKDLFGRRLSDTFRDPTFVTYVRTPGRISVSSSRKRAVEVGTWVGRWLKPDGEMRLTGVYQAMWVPLEGRWRLKNESFVTLRCAGSRSCPDVD